MLERSEILKNFAVGLLPLFVFIIADEYFGTQIGLMVAVLFGIGELLYYWIRQRHIERFVMLDTGLILLLGGISIILDNDLLFKLKPALVESILLVILGIHAFSSKPVLLQMGKRFLKDMKFEEAQLTMIRKLVRGMFVLVLAHVVLIVYSAEYMSKEAWAFISGGLFYILFGVYFAGQWLYLKFVKKPEVINFHAEPGEEWFDLVDANGKVTGRAPRSAVHGNPQLLHPVVHVHVFNKNGQLYLQKRAADKDVQPGKWDTSVGGHIRSGESVESALQRESAEELGLKKAEFEPLYRYIMKNDFEAELVHTFRTVFNGPIRVNHEEIQFGRFWKLKEIEKNLGKNIFTPNFEQEFNMLQQVLHKQQQSKRTVS